MFEQVLKISLKLVRQSNTLLVTRCRCIRCFIVAISTHVAPIAGVALFTVASLADQTAISLQVDRFGVVGNGKTLITKLRVVAALIK